jgi:hypothetical protein
MEKNGWNKRKSKKNSVKYCQSCTEDGISKDSASK